MKPLALAGMIMITGLVGGCTQRHDETAPTPVLSGPPNTTFPMPPLNPSAELGWRLSDGRRAKLGDYRGQVLVLDFYATWCLPCRESIPRLNTLQQTYGPKGVQTVGLNVGGPDDRIKVTQFARELEIEYPLGFPDKDLTDLFLSDNQTIPQTFVFGRQGGLAKRFIGYDSNTGGELERAIQTEVTRQ